MNTKAKIALAVAGWGALLLLGIGAARAQGFVDEPTCYSWEGGRGSAGSFVKCSPSWRMPEPKKVAVAAPVTTPQIAPSPIMMPMSCPPPEPKKPIVKRKPKPPKC